MRENHPKQRQLKLVIGACSYQGFIEQFIARTPFKALSFVEAAGSMILHSELQLQPYQSSLRQIALVAPVPHFRLSPIIFVWKSHSFERDRPSMPNLNARRQ